MMRVLITLWLLAAGAGILVASMYLISDRPNTESNGFVRTFGSATLLGESRGHNLKLVGVQADSFLVISRSDGSVGWIDRALTRFNKIEAIAPLRQSSYATARAIVVGKYLLLVDYAVSAVRQIDLKTGETTTRKFTNGFFDAVPVTLDRFIMRIPKPGNGEHTLALYQSNELIDRFDRVLEKKIDGKFCIDGILFTDLTNRSFAYLYFYRGQVIFMDSLMQVSTRMRTIDTTSVTRIKLSARRSDGTITWASPPPIINNNACYGNNVLVVESMMKADNESTTDFSSNIVFDFYHVTRGYAGSVHIPNESSGRPSGFMFTDGELYVESGTRLVRYKINLPGPSTF